MPGALPAFRRPQLATTANTVPHGDGWLFEMKYDGYRCIAAVNGAEVRLFTRNGHDWTERFGALVGPLSRLTASSALLDGEVCALAPDGRADFSRLSSALTSGGPLVYFAFDLLEHAGDDLAGLPLLDRKDRLEQLLGGGKQEAGAIRFATHVLGNGQDVFDAVCQEGHEGVIAKQAGAPYRSARTRSWLKLKCGQRGAYVIVGWTPSSRKETFASLLLGSWEDGQLVYRGRVGTGFSVDEAEALQRTLDAQSEDSSALPEVPRAIARTARWVTPTLVAEIAFTERTADGLLRHASFCGLRKGERAVASPLDDGELEARGMEACAREGQSLTSPERVAYPEQGVSKAELAGYYDAVAERMLPFIAHRPLSLLRCPQGRAKHCFFQKHDSGGFPAAMASVQVTEKDGDVKPYFVVRDLAGLLAGVQMNVLEWHLWGSHADTIETPERLVFDLDPDDALGFADVRDAARTVAARLEAMGLRSFPLLSGGKGIHVIVPIEPEAEWPDVKAFCRAVAHELAAAEPARFVATMSKARRKGRLFIDYLRNERGATAIAPWSTRARSGAPVAVPVHWQDLDQFERADHFSVRAAVEYAAQEVDPWPDYFTVRQSLHDAIATREVAG
jgi:bifunctional non-homologous end joining protein LigD